MADVSSKSMSQKDASQVLRYAFNDNDMTVSTSGFLDGKIGHRIKTQAVSATIDENLYFDEVNIETTASFTNGSAVVSVPNTIDFKVGQYPLLDVGLAGIPDDTVIVSMTSTTITMSAVFTGTTGVHTLHVANLIKRLRLFYSNAAHDILLDAARVG